ncbi:MAG: hypothetical protein RLZZ210_63 [Pseudomonadota bacterium]|jgi:hypothetical protein
MNSNASQIQEILQSDNQENINKIRASIEAQKNIIRDIIAKNNIEGEHLKEYILGTIQICQDNGTSDIALQELANELELGLELEAKVAE